jgi:hypothetical protein
LLASITSFSKFASVTDDSVSDMAFLFPPAAPFFK